MDELETAKMLELERRISGLEYQNKQLRDENSELRAEVERLKRVSGPVD